MTFSPITESVLLISVCILRAKISFPHRNMTSLFSLFPVEAVI